jgi:hypothetical protein
MLRKPPVPFSAAYFVVCWATMMVLRFAVGLSLLSAGLIALGAGVTFGIVYRVWKKKLDTPGMTARACLRSVIAIR